MSAHPYRLGHWMLVDLAIGDNWSAWSQAAQQASDECPPESFDWYMTARDYFLAFGGSYLENQTMSDGTGFYE